MSELDCCAINIYNNHRWWISFTISIPQHAQIQCKMKQVRSSKWKNEDINSILLTVITINTSKVSRLKLWKGRIVIPQHDSPFLQQIQPKIWSSQHITGVYYKHCQTSHSWDYPMPLPYQPFTIQYNIDSSSSPACRTSVSKIPTSQSSHSNLPFEVLASKLSDSKLSLEVLTVTTHPLRNQLYSSTILSPKEYYNISIVQAKGFSLV